MRIRIGTKMGDFWENKKRKKGWGGVPNNINYQDYTLSKYYNLKEHETYQVDIQGENYKDLYPLSHCEGEGIPG